MPWFSRSSQERTLLVTKNDSLNINLPCIVMWEPAVPISTNMDITIQIPRSSIFGIHATVTRIHAIHCGYVVFQVFSTNAAFRYIAVPIDWAYLSPIQKFRFQRQLANNEQLPAIASVYDIGNSISDTQSEMDITDGGDLLQVHPFIRHIRSFGEIFGKKKTEGN